MRALLAAGVAAAFSCGAAQARNHGAQASSIHRAQDFYASTVAEPAARPEVSYGAGGCFTTNTPAEAAKGIRHWSGGC